MSPPRPPDSRLIKGLPVPPLLIALLQDGTWKGLPVEGLADIAPFLTEPMVWLVSLEEMKGASHNVTEPGQHRLGIQSSHANKRRVDPPLLDDDHSFFIAINQFPGDDIAIALDYRAHPTRPRVVASDWSGTATHCEWRVIAESLDELVRRLRAR